MLKAGHSVSVEDLNAGRSISQGWETVTKQCPCSKPGVWTGRHHGRVMEYDRLSQTITLNVDKKDSKIHTRYIRSLVKKEDGARVLTYESNGKTEVRTVYALQGQQARFDEFFEFFEESIADGF